jgi:hypothetical protein
MTLPFLVLVAVSLLDLYVEAFDLLVEGGERDTEVFGGFGLIPVAALEPVSYDASLDLFHQVEERGVGFVFEQAGGVGVAGELRGEKLRRDHP